MFCGFPIQKAAATLVDIRKIRLCLPRNMRMRPQGKTVNIAIHLSCLPGFIIKMNKKLGFSLARKQEDQAAIFKKY